MEKPVFIFVVLSIHWSAWPDHFEYPSYVLKLSILHQICSDKYTTWKNVKMRLQWHIFESVLMWIPPFYMKCAEDVSVVSQHTIREWERLVFHFFCCTWLLHKLMQKIKTIVRYCTQLMLTLYGPSRSHIATTFSMKDIKVKRPCGQALPFAAVSLTSCPQPP